MLSALSEAPRVIAPQLERSMGPGVRRDDGVNGKFY
jgi:hypothetical protein